MSDPLTELRFWQQVIGDARRTVLCPPEMESRCKCYVDARGLGGLITVVASRACPDDRLYVMDEQALMASVNRPLRLGMIRD